MRATARRATTAWRLLTGTGAAASVALGLLVLGCVLAAVAGPRQSLGLRTRALEHTLASAPALATSVYGTVDYGTFDLAYDRTLLTGDLADARAQLASHLAAQGLPLAGRAADWAGLATAFTPVPGAARSAYDGSTPPQMMVLYRSALSRHARLLAGHLPVSSSAGRAGGDLQVAVTRATATRFGLRLGSRLRVGPAVTLTVTGILAPTGPRSAYWTEDPVAAAPSLNVRLRGSSYWVGSAFVGPAEVPSLPRWFDPEMMQLSWDFPLSLSRVNAAQAQTLAARLTGALTLSGEVFLGVNGTPTVIGLASGLSQSLAAFIAQDRAISTVTGLLSFSLAVVGAAVILLAARLLAEHRVREFAVMRARGASRRQVAVVALRAGAVVTVPAAAAGAALALALTPRYSDSLAWWLAGFTVAVALAGPPLIAARSHTVGGTGRQRPDVPAGRRHAARRLVAEATLAVAAVGGLVVLRRQGLAAGSTDPYESAVPVLIAIPVAIAVMRCYPLVIRLLLRLAGVRPGVTAFVALARAARTPVSALLPAFALVLTLAVVGFGAMIDAAVLRGEVAASWQRTGADAVIDASGSDTPITPATQREIAAVPGVAATAGILLTSGTSASGQILGIAVVDPARYAALAARTPGPAFPAAVLARTPGARPGGAVPVLASGLATALIGRRPTTVSIGVGKLAIRVVRSVSAIPGAPHGAFVVIPSWALRVPRPAPTELLVVGPHLDQRRLLAVTARALPGATVTLRSHILAGLTGAPLPHGADTAFAEVSVAAAGFSLLVLLITLILSARSREFTVARLRVMGLGAGQARWMAAVETLPQVLAAAIGGAGAAWALASLVGPVINLAAFTGTGAAVPLRVEPVPLLAAAAALVALALAALAGQAIISGRRGSSRPLRVAD